MSPLQVMEMYILVISPQHSLTPVNINTLKDWE